VRWDATQLDAALAAVRAPLLVIQSTWITPERKRLPLRKGQSSPWLDLMRTKTSHIYVVPHVGHFTQLEAPAAVNHLIAEFAAGVEPIHEHSS
jgi:pimeloyl-ACP methyl ester carboxylesterase